MLGDFAKAKPLYDQALERNKKLDEPDHNLTSIIRADLSRIALIELVSLADTHYRSGNYVKAVRLYEQALAIAKNDDRQIIKEQLGIAKQELAAKQEAHETTSTRLADKGSIYLLFDGYVKNPKAIAKGQNKYHTTTAFGFSSYDSDGSVHFIPRDVYDISVSYIESDKYMAFDFYVDLNCEKLHVDTTHGYDGSRVNSRCY